MILYHGSNVEVIQIELHKSKPYKDFGRGFYLTEDREQAMTLANYRSSILGGKPTVSCFEFDETLLNNRLEYLHFDTYSEEWARFVLHNRQYAADFNSEYDVIYGPIANDRIGVQIQKLLDGNISMTEFFERIKYFKGITYQYYFGTEQAISFLRKI